jgi:hypothetical protein
VFIRGFDVSKLFRIDVGLRRRKPLSFAREWPRTRPTATAPALTAQHLFNGLHARIRHERMIIPRSSEKFCGTNAGTDNTNYGVPFVLERRGYAKEPSQYRNSPARSAAVGIHVPDYNQSLSSFSDAARTWYYVSSPMFTCR